MKEQNCKLSGVDVKKSGNSNGWDTPITMSIDCEEQDTTVEVDMTLSDLDDFIDKAIKLYDSVRQNPFMTH